MTINDMRNHCIAQRKKVVAAYDAFDKVNAIANADGGKATRRDADKAKAEYFETTEGAEAVLDNVYFDLVDTIKTEYMPNGNNLTADAELFKDNSPIELTLEEVKHMVKKYENNKTMTRIVAGYAEKHYPNFKVDIVTENEELNRAKRLRDYCKRAIRDKVTFDYCIVSDAGWEKISNPFIK